MKFLKGFLLFGFVVGAGCYAGNNSDSLDTELEVLLDDNLILSNGAGHEIILKKEIVFDIAKYLEEELNADLSFLSSNNNCKCGLVNTRRIILKGFSEAQLNFMAECLSKFHQTIKALSDKSVSDEEVKEILFEQWSELNIKNDAGMQDMFHMLLRVIAHYQKSIGLIPINNKELIAYFKTEFPKKINNINTMLTLKISGASAIAFLLGVICMILACNLEWFNWNGWALGSFTTIATLSFTFIMMSCLLRKAKAEGNIGLSCLTQRYLSFKELHEETPYFYNDQEILSKLEQDFGDKAFSKFFQGFLRTPNLG